MNDKINIWVVGTKDGDVKELKNDCYKEFITTHTPELPNINPLNRFLSEFVAMWYVWKNNIYSQYVGFCHYRRLIKLQDIRLDKLDGKIQYFYKQTWNKDFLKRTFFGNDEYPFISRRTGQGMPEHISTDVIEYLKSQTIIPQNILKEYCNPTDKFYYYNREIFFCEWDIFCDLMKFINGYVDFIANKYNLTSFEKWREHISKNVISFYKKLGYKFLVGKNPYSYHLLFQKATNWLKIFQPDEGISSLCNNWRVYSYEIEDLISIYIGTHDRICSNNVGN